MKKLALTVSLFLLPAVAFAETANLSYFSSLIVGLRGTLNALVPMVITIALLVFFWGLIKYIRSSGKGHAEGRNIMIAGLLALFIMVSVWGIVRVMQSILGIPDPTKVETSPGVLPSIYN